MATRPHPSCSNQLHASYSSSKSRTTSPAIVKTIVPNKYRCSQRTISSYPFKVCHLYHIVSYIWIIARTTRLLREMNEREYFSSSDCQRTACQAVGKVVY